MKNSDKPAYPISETVHTGFDHGGEKLYTTVTDGGLTKREIFAKAIISGLVSNSTIWQRFDSNNDANMDEWYARRAKELADELLKQLES